MRKLFLILIAVLFSTLKSISQNVVDKKHTFPEPIPPAPVPKNNNKTVLKIKKDTNKTSNKNIRYIKYQTVIDNSTGKKRTLIIPDKFITED